LTVVEQQQRRELADPKGFGRIEVRLSLMAEAAGISLDE